MKIFPATIVIENGKPRKAPLIKQPEQNASDDPEQHKKWMVEWGDKIKLWGVPCGPDSGILALDVDVKNGKNGFEKLKEFGPLPQTQTQVTPSGGRHYLFEYPKDGEKYINSRELEQFGLDIRATGGWVGWYGLENPSIVKAPAPEWLKKIAKGRQYDNTGESIRFLPEEAQRILGEALENVREAAPGEANNTLNDQAFRVGQLVIAGSYTEEQVKPLLIQAAMERGKSLYEATKTTESGLAAGMAKPQTCPFKEAPTLQIPIVNIKPTRWTPEPTKLYDLKCTHLLKKPQLFEDWSTEDIHLTTADGGTGKTTLKIYEAICLALGERFLGFRCLKPGGKTLFITGEDSEGKLRAMIGAVARNMGLMKEGQEERLRTVLSSIYVKKDEDLCLVAKDSQHFLTPNLYALDLVKQAVDDIRPSMIVFDPISMFWGSEAAVNDMAKAVSKFMSKLQNYSGACVEMINHMGKQSSKGNDLSQFAGRGGTGLPSHARVVRVMRGLLADEYEEMTGEELEDSKTAMLCQVSKFSDGSPLLNKPFVVLREGFLFSRKELSDQKKKETEQKESDVSRIFNFIHGERAKGGYPSEQVIAGHFACETISISKERVKRALALLVYRGHLGMKAKQIENPDIEAGGKVYILSDLNGKDI